MDLLFYICLISLKLIFQLMPFCAQNAVLLTVTSVSWLNSILLSCPFLLRQFPFEAFKSKLKTDSCLWLARFSLNLSIRTSMYIPWLSANKITANLSEYSASLPPSLLKHEGPSSVSYLFTQVLCTVSVPFLLVPHSRSFGCGSLSSSLFFVSLSLPCAYVVLANLLLWVSRNTDLTPKCIAFHVVLCCLLQLCSTFKSLHCK